MTLPEGGSSHFGNEKGFVVLCGGGNVECKISNVKCKSGIGDMK